MRAQSAAHRVIAPCTRAVKSGDASAATDAAYLIASFDKNPSTQRRPRHSDDRAGLPTCHGVAGMLDAATLAAQIQAGNGGTTLTTAPRWR